MPTSEVVDRGTPSGYPGLIRLHAIRVTAGTADGLLGDDELAYLLAHAAARLDVELGVGDGVDDLPQQPLTAGV